MSAKALQTRARLAEPEDLDDESTVAEDDSENEPPDLRNHKPLDDSKEQVCFA